MHSQVFARLGFLALLAGVGCRGGAAELAPPPVQAALLPRALRLVTALGEHPVLWVSPRSPWRGRAAEWQAQGLIGGVCSRVHPRFCVDSLSLTVVELGGPHPRADTAEVTVSIWHFEGTCPDGSPLAGMSSRVFGFVERATGWEQVPGYGLSGSLSVTCTASKRAS